MLLISSNICLHTAVFGKVQFSFRCRLGIGWRFTVNAVWLTLKLPRIKIDWGALHNDWVSLTQTTPSYHQANAPCLFRSGKSGLSCRMKRSTVRLSLLWAKLGWQLHILYNALCLAVAFLKRVKAAMETTFLNESGGGTSFVPESSLIPYKLQFCAWGLLALHKDPNFWRYLLFHYCILFAQAIA